MKKKCPKCGNTELRESKDTQSGLEMRESYCYKCGNFEEEWGGIALWKAYSLANDVEKFEQKVLEWRRQKSFTVFLKICIVLVEETEKGQPDFYRHTIWLLSNTSCFSSVENLQSILQSYLAEADFVSDIPIEKLGNVNKQYFLEFKVDDKKLYEPPSDYEKCSAIHYLALDKDHIEVLTEDKFKKAF
jgi:hypothetical protein